MERSMDIQETVKKALNALYHHPDDAVRMQADQWLQDFQRTIDAWQVADNLLHDTTSNLETLIFCSQMLRSKVQRDVEELPSEAVCALRDSLNTLLKKFHKSPPKVRTQISIAVAALAVHVPAEDWGVGGIVNWLQDEMNSHPEFVPGFLELLTVLPESSKGEEFLSTRDSIIIPRGASITRLLIASLTGALPSSRLETVTHALLALTRAYGVQALEWVKESILLIPLTALAEVERSRFLQALSQAASGADVNALMGPVEELSDVCRRNRTVLEIVQGSLKPLELNRVPVS